MAAPFTAKPGPVHWEAIKRTLCYSFGTRNPWSIHGEEDSPVKGITNANGSTAADWRAMLGQAPLINGGTTPSRPSKRQKIAPSPATKSKNAAATHGSEETSWLHGPVSAFFINFRSPYHTPF